MSWLSDDPTWLAGGLVLAAVACFLALKSTQNGRYLIWGLAALAGAGVVVVVERAWVTDDERIEDVVYALRDALLAGDVDGLLARMTPGVQYVQEGLTLTGQGGMDTRGLIRASLATSKFAIVRIHNLQTSAGRQTRRGKAEFKVFAQGDIRGPFGMGGSGAADTAWSLGFEEARPGVWMVNRITPVALPYNVAATLNSPRPPPGQYPGRHGRGNPRSDDYEEYRATSRRKTPDRMPIPSPGR